jgi:hypothetical protein
MYRVNIGVRVMSRTNLIPGNGLSLHWLSMLHDHRWRLMKTKTLTSRLPSKLAFVRLTPQSLVLQAASRLPELKGLWATHSLIFLLLHPHSLLYQLFRTMISLR